MASSPGGEQTPSTPLSKTGPKAATPKSAGGLSGGAAAAAGFAAMGAPRGAQGQQSPLQGNSFQQQIRQQQLMKQQQQLRQQQLLQQQYQIQQQQPATQEQLLKQQQQLLQLQQYQRQMQRQAAGAASGQSMPAGALDGKGGWSPGAGGCAARAKGMEGSLSPQKGRGAGGKGSPGLQTPKGSPAYDGSIQGSPVANSQGGSSAWSRDAEEWTEANYYEMDRERDRENARERERQKERENERDEREREREKERENEREKERERAREKEEEMETGRYAAPPRPVDTDVNRDKDKDNDLAGVMKSDILTRISRLEDGNVAERVQQFDAQKRLDAIEKSLRNLDVRACILEKVDEIKQQVIEEKNIRVDHLKASKQLLADERLQRLKQHDEMKALMAEERKNRLQSSDAWKQQLSDERMKRQVDIAALQAKVEAMRGRVAAADVRAHRGNRAAGTSQQRESSADTSFAGFQASEYGNTPRADAFRTPRHQESREQPETVSGVMPASNATQPSPFFPPPEDTTAGCEDSWPPPSWRLPGVTVNNTSDANNNNANLMFADLEIAVAALRDRMSSAETSLAGISSDMLTHAQALERLQSTFDTERVDRTELAKWSHSHRAQVDMAHSRLQNMLLELEGKPSKGESDGTEAANSGDSMTPVQEVPKSRDHAIPAIQPLRAVNNAVVFL